MIEKSERVFNVLIDKIRNCTVNNSPENKGKLCNAVIDAEDLIEEMQETIDAGWRLIQKGQDDEI